MNPDDVSVSITLLELPPPRALTRLRRELGLPLSEVQRRVEAREPLVLETLFGNDHLEVARRLTAVLDLVEGHDHEVRELVGAEADRIDADTLRNILTAP